MPRSRVVSPTTRRKRRVLNITKIKRCSAVEYSAFFANEPVSACDAEYSSLAIRDKPVSG